jgi:hypothetical protein
MIDARVWPGYGQGMARVWPGYGQGMVGYFLPSSVIEALGRGIRAITLLGRLFSNTISRRRVAVFKEAKL